MRLRLAETDASGQLATLQLDVDKPTMRFPIQADTNAAGIAWHVVHASKQQGLKEAG